MSDLFSSTNFKDSTSYQKVRKDALKQCIDIKERCNAKLASITNKKKQKEKDEKIKQYKEQCEYLKEHTNELNEISFQFSNLANEVKREMEEVTSNLIGLANEIRKETNELYELKTTLCPGHDWWATNLGQYRDNGELTYECKICGVSKYRV
jgi:uncharacterized phage infection (PIP) family protein YhgE